jgi:hypothetical protein
MCGAQRCLLFQVFIQWSFQKLLHRYCIHITPNNGVQQRVHQISVTISNFKSGCTSFIYVIVFKNIQKLQKLSIHEKAKQRINLKI